MILRGVFLVPISVLSILIGLALLLLYAVKPEERSFELAIATAGFTFVGFFALRWYIRTWKARRKYDPYLILTREGLILPSLGSDKPIPWRDVMKTSTFGSRGGRNLLINFWADPRAYPKMLGWWLRWRMPDRPGEKIISGKMLPNVLTKNGHQIAEAVNQFRMAYGMTAEERAEANQPPPAHVWLLAAFGSIAATVFVTAVFYWKFQPLDLTAYMMLGFLWIMAIPVLYVFLDLYRKAVDPAGPAGRTGRTVWSGFGERRVDLGTMRRRQ